MVAGGHAWLWGGMYGWGACVVVGGVHGGRGVCMGYNEIRSMSGRYASYWNAFLFVSVIAQVRLQMSSPVSGSINDPAGF